MFYAFLNFVNSFTFPTDFVFYFHSLLLSSSWAMQEKLKTEWRNRCRRRQMNRKRAEKKRQMMNPFRSLKHTNIHRAKNSGTLTPTQAFRACTPQERTQNKNTKNDNDRLFTFRRSSHFPLSFHIFFFFFHRHPFVVWISLTLFTSSALFTAS